MTKGQQEMKKMQLKEDRKKSEERKFGKETKDTAWETKVGGRRRKKEKKGFQAKKNYWSEKRNKRREEGRKEGKS